MNGLVVNFHILSNSFLIPLVDDNIIKFHFVNIYQSFLKEIRYAVNEKTTKSNNNMTLVIDY